MAGGLWPGKPEITVRMSLGPQRSTFFFRPYVSPSYSAANNYMCLKYKHSDGFATSHSMACQVAWDQPQGCYCAGSALPRKQHGHCAVEATEQQGLLYHIPLKQPVLLTVSFEIQDIHTTLLLDSSHIYIYRVKIFANFLNGTLL